MTAAEQAVLAHLRRQTKPRTTFQIWSSVGGYTGDEVKAACTALLKRKAIIARLRMGTVSYLIDDRAAATMKQEPTT